MLKHYRRNGKIAYFDPIRAFLVEAKPEEKVRQEFLQLLMDHYGVPEGAIAVEYPLRRSGCASRGRVDILVSGVNGPLMVIECKEPGTRLHDRVLEQACRYAEELSCPHIALTNGTELETFHWNEGSWRRLAQFPVFDELHSLSGHRYEQPRSRDFEQFTIEQLEDYDAISEHENRLGDEWGYRVLGQDTPERLWTPIYSVYDALFHQPDIGLLLPQERGGFRVEEYLGLHFTEYGNYAGGRFPGLYSCFRVVDHLGDDQIYKLGFFGCAHTENDPTFGNRRGTSGIHVAIDDFDKAPRMSLELALDACMTRRATGFDIIHDGKITVGRLGAAKRELLLSYVVAYAPHLVRGRSVVLGSVPAGRVLTFADISEVVFNLLH
jgi:Type I restriction enzyme R protein N terminus (HSDR_N)